MKIGYACLTEGLPELKYRTCIQKNATSENLLQLIAHNLNILSKTIDYNIEHNILLFRISSDIIPFGSSPVNTLDWCSIFSDQLKAIGKKALAAGMRLSMHPGQYTVLNSPDQGVVQRAVLDLEYHTAFLDSLGLDSSHKMILHIGGIYGDKQSAMERFAANWAALSDSVKARLVIENDHKMYTIEDVLHIGESCQIPVIFDNLHHQINPPVSAQTDSYWLQRCSKTWKEQDGRQKTHYSQQAEGRNTGAHSDTIYITPFMEYWNTHADLNFDIMLEVKDKNLSALKCINCTKSNAPIRLLEQEWHRYKYIVLEKSPAVYQHIRNLLKDKDSYPAQAFYLALEEALAQTAAPGNVINASSHVWGYFKTIASASEKSSWEKHQQRFKSGSCSASVLKRFLWKLTLKYQQPYLMESYYFHI